MVQADPVLRPTCLELLAHPWMQGPVPTFQEVQNELELRMTAVQEARADERKARLAEKGKASELFAAVDPKAPNKDLQLQSLYEKYGGPTFNAQNCNKKLA